MRRWLCAVLTMPLLLLAGCGKTTKEEQTALDLRTALQSADSCRFEAIGHADCNGRLYDFTLAYEKTPEEETVTVLEPEEIAKIRANVSPDGTELQFKNLILELGLGEQAISTPLLLPHLLYACMQGAYIADTACTPEGAMVRYYSGYGEDHLELQVLVDRASLTPCSCELFVDGAVILSAEISDFSITN